jgi:hypothetical protein
MDHDLLSPLRDPRAVAQPDWGVMEERLRAACAETDAAPASPATMRGDVPGRWMAAAAAVAMVAAITFYTTPQRIGRPAPSPPVAPSSPEPMTQPGPERLEVPPAAAPRPRPPATRRPTPASAEARLNEFVPLPGAFALPDFESGRIVRMEVPLAGLPAFGIDLVPDAAPAAVEADFLIGQDGLPRAIRLAATRGQ